MANSSAIGENDLGESTSPSQIQTVRRSADTLPRPLTKTIIPNKTTRKIPIQSFRFGMLSVLAFSPSIFHLHVLRPVSNTPHDVCCPT